MSELEAMIKTLELAGYEVAKKDDRRELNGWIPVIDRKPDNARDVLVLEDHEQHTSYYVADTDEWDHGNHHPAYWRELLVEPYGA